MNETEVAVTIAKGLTEALSETVQVLTTAAPDSAATSAYWLANLVGLASSVVFVVLYIPQFLLNRSRKSTEGV